MTYCPNCGSQATGSFCPNCGTPLRSGTTTGSQASGFAPSATASSASGISENVASALCYTPFFIGVIISIVMLVIAPYNTNRTVRFHALQSLFTHLAVFLISIVLSFVIGMVALVTHGAGFLLGGLYPLLWVATLVLFFVMMYQAYNRQRTKLPFVGDLAEKQA